MTHVVDLLEPVCGSVEQETRCEMDNDPELHLNMTLHLDRRKAPIATGGRFPLKILSWEPFSVEVASVPCSRDGGRAQRWP